MPHTGIMPMKIYDVAIVGGGIVGLATALQLLQQRPGTAVLLIEKEKELASHQTGHNSGVIHSGIYYKPGSLRAINCREGKIALEKFCEQCDIPYDRCGKVIVATDQSQLSRLEKVYQRGIANGIECEKIGKERLSELEPQVSGVAAIHVPGTGIIDYKLVAGKLAEQIRAGGADIRCETRLKGLRKETASQIMLTSQGDFASRIVVTCAGLQSDRVARVCGADVKTKIIPFRGEYYELKPTATHLCRNLIYPVPDPRFPFLGVHFTRMMRGGVECGPNAVLAFSREGYTKTNINCVDLIDSLTFPGFIKLSWKYWHAGLGEMWRSFSKTAFVEELKKMIPEIQANDLKPAPAGVRAQAVGSDGELVDDFLIETDERTVNVLNAPSPAATASLNIGKTIVEKVTSML